MSFDYPSTWEVGSTDNGKGPYNENCYIQPKGQEFEAKPGQVVIRLFDPVSIMEDAGTFEATFSKELFREILTQISDGGKITIDTITYLGNFCYQCVQYNSGFATKFIGCKSPRGNLYVLGMAESPAITSLNNAILFRVAKSLSGGEPKKSLTPQELVVKNWYRALANGNKTELENLACESAREVGFAMDIATRVFKAPGRSSFLEVAKLYVYSNLGYYTIASNNQLAVVRICGNIITPDLQTKSFYNFTNLLGGSNLYVVKLENGQWKMCQSVKRFHW